jgi:hypothetical protein
MTSWQVMNVIGIEFLIHGNKDGLKCDARMPGKPVVGLFCSLIGLFLGLFSSIKVNF